MKNSIRNMVLMPVMILYELYQEVSANVKRAAPGGYNTTCWFREVDKFTSLKTPPASGTVEGQMRIITETHTFAVDDGFIQGSGHQEGGSMEGEPQGEPGEQGLPMYKFTLFFVGDHAPLRERVEEMSNRSFVLLFKDPKCSDTRILQLGGDCDPALTSFKFTSGSRKTGGKKGYLVTFQSSELNDYQGTVTEKVPSS